MGAANAIELTADAAWFIADTVGAGTLPWVLAVTPPYRDGAERAGFVARQAGELTRMGVMRDGRIDRDVADWLRVVCFPERWLEMRYVRAGSGDLMRGVVARRGNRTIAAFRNLQLVTFSAMDIADTHALVPILVAALPHRAPARFTEFALTAKAGARADERLRAGAELSGVLDYLGIPDSARTVVQSVFSGPRSYVEIVAGRHHDGAHITTEVGVGIADAEAGRVLISPTRAFDGEWVSTFAPATPLAVAVAIDQLSALLPDGRWFPDAVLSRDFTSQRS